MRLIFEEDYKEDSFEIALSEKELQQLTLGKGAYGFVLGGLWNPKNLNVFLRKETNEEMYEKNEQAES